MRDSRSHLQRLFFILVLQPIFFSTPAPAALIYGTDYVVDTSSGLRWQSTLATAGQPGPQIPDNRLIRGGLRLAIQGEVEALFTSNFPQLASVLSTPLAPVSLDPDVIRLIEALGGGLQITTIEIPGQPPWELFSHIVRGWIAAPGTRTSVGEPYFWGYVSLSLGYSNLLGFPIEPPFDDFTFLSSAPFFTVDRELSSAGAGSLGYFLVSAAVPTPGSALLFSLGLLLIRVGRSVSLT